jgi:hypothetical protein
MGEYEPRNLFDELHSMNRANSAREQEDHFAASYHETIAKLAAVRSQQHLKEITKPKRAMGITGSEDPIE